MHDVLSGVLEALELESSVYFRAELSSPFSIAVPEDQRVVRFHIASEGRCLVTIDGEPPVAFAPGELVMIPHGRGHILSDVAKGPARPLADVLDASAFDGEGPLVYGGGGEQTTLVCGHFGFSPETTHPFIETLPSIIHLRPGDGPDYRWVEQMLAFTERESRSRSTGWQGIVERLSQILFVYVLRAYIEREEETAGALAALSDTQLAAALQAIHAAPARDWTLDSLAQQAGMSRSAFVRRFNEVCGMPPVRYLTQWRLSRARFLLSRSPASAGEVAAAVGYASEAAFNRAFKEHFDQPPAAFARRTRRSEGSGTNTVQ